MFDANGGLAAGPGLLQGNSHFPGNFHSCLEVAAPGFSGQHCLVLPAGDELLGGALLPLQPAARLLPAPPPRPAQLPGLAEDPLAVFRAGGLRLGRCIPSSCTAPDLQLGFQHFFNLAAELLSNGTEHSAAIGGYPLNCHTADEQTRLDGGDWAMIAVVAVFGFLVFIGTILDFFYNVIKMEISQKILQIFHGFSLYSNTLKLFNTDCGRSEDSLSCIHGIRVLSLTWVASYTLIVILY